MKHEREFRRLPETEVAIGVVLQAAANEQACRGVQGRAGAGRRVRLWLWWQSATRAASSEQERTWAAIRQAR